MRSEALETPKEWYQCLEAGTAAVRRPHELRQFGRHDWPKLTVYHIPSSADCFGWTVYQARGATKHTLRTVIWRQLADGQRMQDLMHGRTTNAWAEPTLEAQVSFLEARRFDEHLAGLGAIRIPLFARRRVGCGGEIFGVSVPREFEVEWWCDGPPEWVDLARWTHGCIKMFRDATAA
jgi:hypothetical protein